MGKGEFIPGHEYAPLDAHAHAVLHVGNGAVLGHLDHLLRADYAPQFGVDILPAAVVVGTGVAVVAYDIHQLMSGVPVGLGGAPDPDQVVELVVVGIPGVHELVEFLGVDVGLAAPPEPLPSCLVQRTPYYRYFAALQFLQLNCNCVQISYCSVVLGSIGDYSFGNIEIGVLGVEGGGSELASHGREPVPEEDDDSLLVGLLVVPLDGLVDCAVVSRLPVVPGVVGRVVLHVKTSHQRFLPCLADKLIVVKSGLS